VLKQGDVAPDFCLPGIDDKGGEQEYCLGDLLKNDQEIVLYVYPKDSSPGCTQEACDFRDSLNRIGRHATVIGISKDSLKSHRSFREKQGLNFPLLSDPECRVLMAYDAWGEKIMYGRKTEGTIRCTFIIGKDGFIVQAWRNVRVKGHVEEIIAALEAGTGS
jgi:peroxiredoxin Q/BCP